MSITSRINEMSSHIEQAYDELQGLGADLTNVNKNIENISMVLDDIYDSMPQVSGEGTSLTLDDTRVGKIKSTLKGNTSQTGTPTPSSPVPVNVVSGDNEILVNGKNLLKINDMAETTTNGITYSCKDGVLTLNGTATSGVTIDFERCLLPSGTYYISRNGTGTTSGSWQTYLRNDSGNIRQGEGSFTTTEGQYVYFRLFMNSGVVFTNYTFKPMINLGSTKIDFEPYQGNTYNIDLPEGMELCKIGNYQDYFYKDSDKWYLHKEIGKVVLNGSESWQVHGSIASWFYYDGLQNVIYAPSENLGISNYFVYKTYYPNATTLVNGEFTIGQGANNMGRLVIKNTEYTTANTFKNWLASNNVTCYYILSTPTNIEVEYQPLIEQLNLLEKAQSKENQTNISQVNNDLPFIISASALKEWQESTSLNSTLSMVNPLSLGNTLNTQDNDIQPIEVDNIEPLEEEENEES